jgi:hypothetical protein
MLLAYGPIMNIIYIIGFKHMGPQPKIYEIMLQACGPIIAVIYSLCSKLMGPLYIYEYAPSL